MSEGIENIRRGWGSLREYTEEEKIEKEDRETKGGRDSWKRKKNMKERKGEERRRILRMEEKEMEKTKEDNRKEKKRRK